MTKISLVKLKNYSEKPIKLVLEPWADEYKISPGMEVDISTNSPEENLIAVDYYEEIIVVWGWSNDMKIESGGKLLETDFS